MWRCVRAQSEFIGDEDRAYISGMSLAVVQAIKDANLTEGLEQLYEFATNITDPETKDEQILRFIGQNAQLFIPNHPED